MKRVLALLCVLAVILSLGILPASAATGDVMKLQYVSLRTQEGKEGIYFGATFALTQATITAMGNTGCYGLAATTTPMADDTAWAAAMGEKVQYSSYKGGLTAGQSTYVRSTSVVNIININNDSSVNTRNASTTIYVRPYVKLADGSYIFGDAGKVSMKQVAQMIDNPKYYNTLDDEQRKGLLGMYERFSASMKNWGLTNLKDDYETGGYVTVTDENGKEKQVSLVLQYRRDKVTASMTAQNDVLWSIGGNTPITYSRKSNSKGVDEDRNQYPDDIYTLYPDRVYKGIPYAHGASSLGSFQMMGYQDGAYGEPDADGVYVFNDFHSAYLNGGSYENKDEYNVARLGNDCWDMVHWAWETICSDVTADQTAEMTPSYGLILLGEDILEEAMQGFTAPDGRVMDGSIWDFICNQNKEGQYVYRSIDETDPSTQTLNYTAIYWGSLEKTYTETLNNTHDGTAIVRYATRSFEGFQAKPGTILVWEEENYVPVFDYQPLYKSYALAQPGDAMVRYANGKGHAVMIMGINVVYKEGSTTEIDGDKSAFIILEQGGEFEKRQSRDTWGDYTQTAHSSHSKVVADCKYCAGYTGKKTADGREIWALDYEPRSVTFNEQVQGGYLAVSCAALQNYDATIPTSRIADSETGSSNVNDIFTGTLKSTYRVEYVTLDIYDVNGNKVNSATCFGLQDGVTQPFALSRFLTDQDRAAHSVLAGTPEIVKKTDGTTTWLEARTLDPGEYTFTLTCKLGNGFERTFRTGVFAVNEGTNRLGQTALLITLPVE